MNFIEITKKYFNYRKKDDLWRLRGYFDCRFSPAKEMFDEFEGFVQKNVNVPTMN